MNQWIALFLFFSQYAHAYSYIDNRGLYPLGEKEIFMSNTGIALTESSGSVFYNPAGLATVTAAKLSLSSNTYFSSKTQFKSIQTLDGKDMPFTSTGTQSIPSSLISAWKGDSINLAFGIFVPHQLKSQDSALYTTDNYDAIQMTRSQSFQVLMAGGSIAGKVNDSLALGVSCFYTTFQTSQQFDLSGAPTAGSGLKPVIASSYFNSDISGGICHFGAQKSLSDHILLGFVIKSPLITTSKKGTSSQFIQEPNQGIFKFDGPKEVDTEFAIPGELSTGIKLEASDRLTFYSDLNYQMDASYKDGNLISSKFEHAATLRYSAGVQFKISDKNEILAGFSYNPSTLKAPKAEAQENFFVGTFGFQSQNANSVFGLGLFIAQSYGSLEVSKLNSSFQELGTYNSDVKTSITGLLISSGFAF